MLPRLIAAALLLLFAATAHPQSVATNSPTPLSTRVVAYTIDARVDPTRHTLDATETLTYRNLTGQPLTTFPFHLYLNAFQPDSTFTTETHFHGGIRASDAEDSYADTKRGSITLTRLEAEAPDGHTANVLPLLHFTAPDDANQNDRTVAQLTLPQPLLPNQSITFHLTFHDLFPESVARNGYKRDFLMGGQWYPKLGVFWHGAWNCHQYHANTEFFSDFATFNVSLTLPRNYTVGASGVPTADHTNAHVSGQPDTRTLAFYGEDIHDFAFAASPNFLVSTATYLSTLGPVQVRVFTLRGHPFAAARYRAILLSSLREFESRFGPYPYKILTLVDPEPGSEIGGMEYPTLVTGDAHFFDPTELLEETAEHEFGHQYWYGMVATNEFEDAWLDEGINSYTEANVLGTILGPQTSFIRLPWANLSDAANLRLEYLAATSFDPVTRPAWLFFDANAYGGVTYGKSATLLLTLESLIGRDTMAEAMRLYFQRFAFKHPTTEDFLTTIEEVAIQHGRTTGALIPFPRYQTMSLPASSPADESSWSQSSAIINSGLRPFFNQAVYGTAILDYAVDNMESTPVQWWLPDNDPHQSKLLRSTVTIHRLGDSILPVDLEITFSDGTHRTEHWAPNPANSAENTRWHTYTYTSEAHPISAEIKPLPLDIDHFNNSRTEATNSIPTRKLTTLWLTVQQSAAQLAGWLI